MRTYRKYSFTPYGYPTPINQPPVETGGDVRRCNPPLPVATTPDYHRGLVMSD